MMQFLMALFTMGTGVLIGYTAKTWDGPNTNQVRIALYKACATGATFDPSERQLGAYCSRLSIDNTMATVYGGAAVAAPSSDAAETARYEAPLVAIRQNVSE
jgi:hypothetical protein